MRNNNDPQLYLTDIIEAIQYIETYLLDAPKMGDFIQGKGLYQDAIVRNIEIIGEAAKKVPESYKAEHPNVPWKQMAGMRDKIIHDYADIDWEEVWKVASEDIKTLKQLIVSEDK